MPVQKTRLGYSPLLLGILTLSFAGIVIFGWVTNIPVLMSISENYISMKFNTALCFAILSLCLIVTSLYKKKLFIITAFELLVAAFCISTLLQGLLGWELGIDQLFFPDKKGILMHNNHPGRMSELTDILFIITGIGMAGLSLFNKKKLISQYLFHTVTIISFISISGYLFGLPAFYKFLFVTPMAIHTCTTFFFLSLGASSLNPGLGIARIFTEKNTGSIIAKKLFLQIMFAIIIFTYLRLELHKYDLIDVEYSLVIMAVFIIIITFFFIWKAANQVNISELKQKEAERQFRLVVESAPNALVMADASGNIKLINKEGEKLFGYDREALIGEKIEVLIPKKFRNRHPANRKLYKAAPSARSMGAGRDLYAVRSDGSEFPVEIGLNPIKTDKEELILASIIDITERKKQENIIADQLAELKLKNRELEQFNYIASHDLQEPLRTVTNFIQIIDEDYGDKLEPGVKEYLDTINAATLRMNLLVKSLLDFARLGKDKQLVRTDCNLLVNNIIADLGGLVSKSGAQVHCNRLPVIFAYEIELGQVFQNLINNAIKFAKKEVAPVIDIGCAETDGLYEFWVQDNGIGINPKYSERIFHIFQRLNKESEFEGHGIGLANCNKIVNMHRGKIWVESQPGEGSIFKFTIHKFTNHD